MVSNVTSGTLLMVVAGVLSTLNMIWSKILKEQEWPYFRLFGTSCLLISLCIATGLALSPQGLPQGQQRKWVLLRGTFGAFTYFLAVVSVTQGTPMGDVATLTSVNMVVAAFLGRLLLGEPLRWIHLLALGCSLAGAVLISRPSFIFPSSEGAEGTAWIGYLLAPASGFFQACSFISSRKAAGASAWIHLLSTVFQCGCGGLLLPLFVHDSELDRLAELPHVSAGWLALVLVCILGSSFSTSTGSRWCPAAISATTSTAVRMASSYMAQTLLFGESLAPLTLLGAALMLGGVMTMASSAGSGGQQQQVEQSPASLPAEQESSSAGEETESLASFIAAEFVDCAHHERFVRQRRTGGGPEPAPQALGAMASLATVAI